MVRVTVGHGSQGMTKPIPWPELLPAMTKMTKHEVVMVGVDRGLNKVVLERSNMELALDIIRLGEQLPWKK
jgi:hypothetical protein